MSASEKLKALDEAFDTQRFLGTLNYYIGPGARTATSQEQVKTYYDVKAVLAALPQIVAVVERNERLIMLAEHLWQMIPQEVWREHGAEWMGQYEGDHHADQVRGELVAHRAALAALEKALSTAEVLDPTTLLGSPSAKTEEGT